MTLGLTLLCRDGAEVVDAQLAFHLSAGVDLIVVSGVAIDDATASVVERHARDDRVLSVEPGRSETPDALVTRMVRHAAAELAADWVITAEPGEFWWPRGGSLKAALALVPDDYEAIRAYRRTFLPVAGDAHFAERMCVRLAATAPVGVPRAPWRPVSKVIRRSDRRFSLASDGEIARGGECLRLLRTWAPVEILHFPLRSGAETAREQPGDRLLESEPALAVDERLRDVLRELADVETLSPGQRFEPPSPDRALRMQRPGLADDVAWAVEAAVYREWELVRGLERADRLGAGLGSRS